MLKQKLIDLEHNYNLLTNRYVSKEDLRQGLLLLTSIITTTEGNLAALKAVQKLPITVFRYITVSNGNEEPVLKTEKESYLLNYFSYTGDPESTNHITMDLFLKTDINIRKAFWYNGYYSTWFILKVEFAGWLKAVRDSQRMQFRDDRIDTWSIR